MADMVKTLRANGYTVTELDLGGGLWVAYENPAPPPVDEYAKMIADIFGDLDIHVALEPGRILIAESGMLLTRVIYTKERDNKQFVIVDGAMNDLIRPTLYDAYHPILPVKQAAANETLAPRDLVGPVCETGDYFALGRELPPLNRGDLVAILITGAYGTVMSSLYNTRPFCAEIMLSNGNVNLIRYPQKLEDIWKDEVS
jgi:diaminopimelate decarboxylase